jgi:hypothetical protein
MNELERYLREQYGQDWQEHQFVEYMIGRPDLCAINLNCVHPRKKLMA